MRLAKAFDFGCVWINTHIPLVAEMPHGGYKKSGIGRETHKLALNHYQQTKNLLVSYSENKLGFF